MEYYVVVVFPRKLKYTLANEKEISENAKSVCEEIKGQIERHVDNVEDIQVWSTEEVKEWFR